MKIKRFVAPDMRQAMRQVREDQGPDAVILSTRRLDDGIEIIAAIDYDEALVREASAPRPPAQAAERYSAVAEPADEPSATTQTPAPEPNAQISAQTSPASAPDAAPSARPRERAAPSLDGPVLGSVFRELGEMREMLESQLASLAWNDLGRRQPQRARALRELTRLGLDADIAQQLVAELPADMSTDQARYLPLGLISRRLLTSRRDLTDVGGTLALVGPTGVGKTTTIAKLAARAVLRHGADEVALISTDNYRIGAGAQLDHYSRLLGVPVYSAHDAVSLHQVLGKVSRRRTVLIDTAGMGAHDERLRLQLDILGSASTSTLRTCLVMAANAHPLAIDEAARAFLPLKPRSCILTKLDEAPSLGGVLSVLIRHQLVLDYVTDGQRVPEDIATADARRLACRAAKVLGQPGEHADDLLMAERFGRRSAALA
ncbi:flagellar biosynthesis protein FlhF [Oleiagrimonas sp. C23AA]|uniref:flagellar biosynthesis protein FlhF n=1 Tax=Oleiagrimonas sp. C23AA TaxID=2719047 RepID=UPI0014221A3A|nr:flagellar biosynthesis protein FlhF [Oleiagrimonas sp. C23AA]NII09179.1 flagellar biosynthesis protein FlhF [Oleiagrimonas sp. C23AA]